MDNWNHTMEKPVAIDENKLLSDIQDIANNIPSADLPATVSSSPQVLGCVDITPAVVDQSNMTVAEALKGDLINFVRSQITKVQAKNNLKDLVVEQITNRIMNDVNGEISVFNLTKLLEVLGQQDNDVIIALLETMNANREGVVINNNNKVASVSATQSTAKPELPFSNQDISRAKEILHLMDEIKMLGITPENKSDKVLEAHTIETTHKVEEGE